MPQASPGSLPKLLQIFFKYLYHQFAWSYDLVAWFVSVGQWKDWVSTVLPFLSGDRVLELGFGPGHLQRMGDQAGFRMYGLDLSPQMVKIARRRLLKNHQELCLLRGSGVALPLEDQSFETVVATFPAEYIIFPETLSQIYRVLEPGGQFVLLPLALITGSGPFHRFTAWLFQITGLSAPVEHPAMEQGYQLLKNAGFTTKVETLEKQYSKVIIVIARKGI
jgi:ubiquinone/menaquinone biosynthesis C-methylase UbiE